MGVSDGRSAEYHAPGARLPADDVAACAFVRAAGYDLWTTRSGSGPPLLLINGLGANLSMWEPFCAQLDGHEVIRFDMPGAGRSSPALWPMRMRRIAEVIVELLDVLQVPRTDVLGYSLGGMVAQELARRAPDRVGRLVLAATHSGLPSVPPPPWIAGMMMTPARYYHRGLAEVLVPMLAGGRTAREPDVLHAGLNRRLRQPPSLVGYAHQLYAATGWSSHAWLRRLPHPTLVLHGDEDPLVPLLNARYLAWALPHGRLEVLEGAGHLLIFDQPQDAAAVVSSFLAATPVSD